MTNKLTSQLNTLKKIMLLFFLVTIGVSNSIASANNDKPISIAVVNVAYLLKNAPEAELASQALKASFLPRERVLQKAQETIKKLEAERDQNKTSWTAQQLGQIERKIRSLKRERIRASEDFREELRFARQTALDDVQKSVFQAIADVREQRGIDIIIENAVSASERVDLTPHVLEYLQAQLALKQSEEANKNKKTEN